MLNEKEQTSVICDLIKASCDAGYWKGRWRVAKMTSTMALTGLIVAVIYYEREMKKLRKQKTSE